MPALRRLAYRFYQWFWSFLDLLFPPNCGGCGKKGARWCSGCQTAAKVISPPVCTCCGRSSRHTGLCTQCAACRPSFTALRSWAVFDGPVRKALHRLKYRGDIPLGEALSRSMLQPYLELDGKPDLIVPVPLSIARFRERGYNQSAFLARPLALSLGLPYSSNALGKIRETRSQVDLHVAERYNNVAGAFKANSALVKGRRILVVDDVTTSGATLEACAEALFNAGAAEVYCLTLARTAHRSGKDPKGK